jgi:hypothetical protein
VLDAIVVLEAWRLRPDEVEEAGVVGEDAKEIWFELGLSRVGGKEAMYELGL